MDNNKRIKWVIGIIVPVLFIIFLVGVVFIPRLGLGPEYDFLYITYDEDNDYRYHDISDIFEVNKDGQLVERDIDEAYDDRYYYDQDSPAAIRRNKEFREDLTDIRDNGVFYIYDVSADEAKEITKSEAMELKLDPDDESPDGFMVGRGRYSYSAFDLFSDSDRDMRISSENYSRKLNIDDDENISSYYWSRNNFIGWVIEG